PQKSISLLATRIHLPPAVAKGRQARCWIAAGAQAAKAMLFVEGDGARIVLVHFEPKSARRDALRLRDERFADALSPMIEIDDDLVEVAKLRRERNETKDAVARAGHAAHHEAQDFQLREMHAQPFAPLIEIDGRHRLAPCSDPEVEHGFTICLLDVAKREGRGFRL